MFKQHFEELFVVVVVVFFSQVEERRASDQSGFNETGGGDRERGSLKTLS